MKNMNILNHAVHKPNPIWFNSKSYDFYTTPLERINNYNKKHRFLTQKWSKIQRMKKSYQIGGLLKKNRRCKESNRSNIEKNEKKASSPPSPCTAVSPKPPPELSLGRNSLSTGHHRRTSLSRQQIFSHSVTPSL
jgi:hypothetical protein